MVYFLASEQAIPRWPSLFLLALLSYLVLANYMRYQRLNRTTCRLGFSSRSSLAKMTIVDAFQIHNYLIELEFPTTFAAASIFALFKAYGIPSISNLLVQTNQLAGPPLSSSKRYADTGALLKEAVLNKPGSDRSVTAIARINYLHDRHRARGKIADQDMLYTLSLFALEPARWLKRHEWRELNEMELCAVGIYWKYLGDALKVPFELLPGSKTGWRDGLEWLQELREWSEAYEKKHMMPAQSNKKLADSTLDIMLYSIPSWAHGIGVKFFGAFLEERVRNAMLYVRVPPRIGFPCTCRVSEILKLNSQDRKSFSNISLHSEVPHLFPNIHSPPPQLPTLSPRHPNAKALTGRRWQIQFTPNSQTTLVH